MNYGIIINIKKCPKKKIFATLQYQQSYCDTFYRLVKIKWVLILRMNLNTTAILL